MDNPAEKRVTLKSLAEITGLGISTVSQALRNSTEISEETRKRVQLAAQQAGYRPNRAGVRLRTGKTNVISVVLNAGDGGAGFFADFVFGISDGLKGTDYHLVVTPYSLSDPMEPVRYIVETNSADGVIISRTQPDDPRVRFLTDSKMPFATHGRTEMGIEHPYHDYDNESFAFHAVRLLSERGRKNVTLIGPPPSLTYAKHIHQGFERAVSQLGLSARPMGSLHSDMTLSEVREAVGKIASQPNYPDGIVSNSSATAVAIMAGYRDQGRLIGKDYDIVTKQTSELAAIVATGIISIPEDFREAGFSIVQKVIAAIEGKQIADLQHVISPVL